MQDQGLARRELIAAGLAGAAVALPPVALAQSGARAPDAPRSAPAACLLYTSPSPRDS